MLEYICHKCLFGHLFVSNFFIHIYSDIRLCKYFNTNIFWYSFVTKFPRMSHSDLENATVSMFFYRRTPDWKQFEPAVQFVLIIVLLLSYHCPQTKDVWGRGDDSCWLLYYLCIISLCGLHQSCCPNLEYLSLWHCLMHRDSCSLAWVGWLSWSASETLSPRNRNRNPRPFRRAFICQFLRPKLLFFFFFFTIG